MKDPIQYLMEQHEEGIRQLDILGKEAKYIMDNGFKEDSFQELQNATRFIDEEIRNHNKKEEEILFPELERFLPQGGPTTVMREEHQELWNTLDRLTSAIRVLKNNSKDEKAIKDMYNSAVHIVGLLNQHIDKENHILFPMARRFLGNEGLKRVAEKMNLA